MVKWFSTFYKIKILRPPLLQEYRKLDTSAEQISQKASAAHSQRCASPSIHTHIEPQQPDAMSPITSINEIFVFRL